jgi:hypothetical protein
VSLTPAETDIRAVRVCQTAALMVPCSLLAAQPGMAGVFGFGAAMVLLVVTWRPRLRRMTPLEEALAQLFLLAAITGLFAVAARGTGERAAFGRYLTVGMLALALPRAAFIPTPAARAGTLAFGLLALMGMARSVGPITFGAATGAYLMAALAAVVQADPGIGPLARHPRGLLLPFGLAGALALGIMGLLGWGLPAAEPVVTEYLEPYLGDGETGTSGFSDGNVRLDRLREIQTSDEVVLRLEGAPLNRLRGQVYRQYHGAVWHPVAATTPLRFAGRDGRLPLLPGEASAPVRGRTQVEVVSAQVGRALMVPLETWAIEGVPETTAVDTVGRVRAPADADVSRYTLETTAGDDAPLPGEVDETDLSLTAAQRAWLRPLADWIGLPADARHPGLVLDRLRAYFAGFRYTLQFDETSAEAREPVRDFLERTHAGHCELFASAAVLLLRARGIPARFVTGFRSAEFNTIGGYGIVRGRDAHAWVEVFIEGRWRTFDPTPAAGLEAERGAGAGPWGQRLDVLARAASRALVRLQNLSDAELWTTIGLIAALSGLFVFLRRRGASRGGRTASAETAERFEPLAALEAVLVRRQAPPRPPGRTLEAQADLLEGRGLPRAAALMRACAALRYGREGDSEAVARAIASYVREGEREGERERDAVQR